MNALEPILAQTRRELERREAATSAAVLRERAEQAAGQAGRRDFGAALRTDQGISVIAEHKRRSPSAGAIRADWALSEVVGAYERAGAAALSILTEGPHFGGSLDDLSAAREASRLPILRKDFMVSEYQLWEAVVAGADAVLLIVAALRPTEVLALRSAAEALGLAVLVEVHDRDELRVAADCGARLIGVNNRDLTTLQVDLERTFSLIPELPPDVLVVAESGFRTRVELDRLQAAGVDAVLIGEALMRSADPEAACRELTGSAI